MPSAAKRAHVVRRAVETIKKTLSSSLEPEVEAFAVERALQVAIEALLDMGEMVISQQRGIAPQTYKGIADELRRLGVLNHDEAQKLKQLAGLRNLLVHMYAEVDYAYLRSEIEEIINDIIRLLEVLEKQGGDP